MQGPGRPDIVNAGSGETRYSKCRVLGNWSTRRKPTEGEHANSRQVV
ncbi:unnamed protein product, partial [Staurois parvus]